MIPIALVNFLRAYWVYIAVGVAVLGVVAGIYREGGRAPRAELAEYKAQIEAAEDEAVLLDALKEEQSDEATKTSDQDLKQQREQINRTWAGVTADLEKTAADAARRAAELDRKLRDATGSAGTGSQSVREPTGSPDQAAGSDGLPDAVERYLAEVRSTLAGERAEASRLFQACHGQTAALVIGQSWVGKQKVINLYSTDRIGATPPGPQSP